MTGAITPGLHILGLAAWVGRQFFLLIAAVPDDTALLNDHEWWFQGA